MKRNKYMAIVGIDGIQSTFTYNTKNKKEGIKELKKFFNFDSNESAKKHIKINLIPIKFDVNFYYDPKTGRRF